MESGGGKVIHSRPHDETQKRKKKPACHMSGFLQIMRIEGLGKKGYLHEGQ